MSDVSQSLAQDAQGGALRLILHIALPRLGRSALLLGGGLGLGLVAWTMMPQWSSSAVSSPAAPLSERRAWTPVPRPLEAYSLDLADPPRDQRHYEARRHGNGREDILTLGSFEGSGAYIRVSLYRPAPDAPAPGTLFLDIARRASETGLSVDRSAAATAVASKFGPVEVADISLESAAGGRACLAFRHVAEDPDFRVSGWSCGAPGRPVDRVQLACQLDRLNLLAGAQDKPLRALFLKAERGRDPACSPPRLSAAGRKSGWLDPDIPAQLR